MAPCKVRCQLRLLLPRIQLPCCTHFGTVYMHPPCVYTDMCICTLDEERDVFALVRFLPSRTPNQCQSKTWISESLWNNGVNPSNITLTTVPLRTIRAVAARASRLTALHWAPSGGGRPEDLRRQKKAITTVIFAIPAEYIPPNVQNVQDSRGTLKSSAAPTGCTYVI